MVVNSVFYYIVMCGLDVGKALFALLWIIGIPANPSKKKITFSCVSSALIVMIGYRYLDAVLLPLFYLIVVLWNVEILMKLKNLARILLTIITFLCICEIDYFTGTLIRLLLTPQYISESALSIVISAIGLGSWFLISYVCRKNEVSFYKDREVKNSVFISVEIAILFVNMSVVGIMFGILSEDTTHKSVLLLLAAMLMVFVISIITLIFYCSVTSARKYKRLNEINTAYLIAQKEHFEKEKQNNLASRKFRHDISNHLTILYSLMSNMHFEEAKSYLEEISGKLSEIQMLIRTGNDIVDAIVNEKIQRAKKYDTEIIWEGTFPMRLSISDFDICTIMANALDNAIEACARIKAHCIIAVSIATHKEFMRIIIRNPVEEPVTLKTRKQDRNLHGLGLENIEECVKRNSGEYQIITSDDTFTMDILFRAFDFNEIL